MEIDYLLTSTRAVRKGLDLDAPVDLAEIKQCLRIACQASNGSNTQGWKWIVVHSAEARKKVADLYQQAYVSMTGLELGSDRFAEGTDPQSRMLSSVSALVNNFDRIPLFVVPCYEPYMGPAHNNFQLATYYGSIFPAVWNLILALHSRGYGSSITTLHLMQEEAFAEALGIPDGYMQGCMIPIGKLPEGKTFSPAPRKPIEEVIALDSFNGDSF